MGCIETHKEAACDDKSNGNAGRNMTDFCDDGREELVEHSVVSERSVNNHIAVVKRRNDNELSENEREELVEHSVVSERSVNNHIAVVKRRNDNELSENERCRA